MTDQGLDDMQGLVRLLGLDEPAAERVEFTRNRRLPSIAATSPDLCRAKKKAPEGGKTERGRRRGNVKECQTAEPQTI